MKKQNSKKIPRWIRQFWKVFGCPPQKISKIEIVKNEISESLKNFDWSKKYSSLAYREPMRISFDGSGSIILEPAAKVATQKN